VRILIAPDKFKGALNAREVSEHLAAGIHMALPDAQIDIVPMADGGEGTAETICNSLGGSWVECKARDPIGREIAARYAWIDDEKLAVMEMSEAAGLRRLQPNEYNPDRASTFGVGEMILDAAKRGARKIIVGLGGSATNDGGFGMARALGFGFFDEQRELTGAMSDLQKLTRIIPPSLRTLRPPRDHDRVERRENEGESNPLKVFRAALPKISAAVDVRNPLLGENGATRVFGPQKGVTEDKISLFEASLAKLADVVAKEFGRDFRNEHGAGAAGGLGFGLMSFCNACMRPGFDVVAEAVDLESKMKAVDIVITGEGSLDRQTLNGKTPAGVAHLAKKLGKPVYAIAGRAEADKELHKMFSKIFVVAEPGLSESENMARAAELLEQRGRELGGHCKASPENKVDG